MTYGYSVFRRAELVFKVDITPRVTKCDFSAMTEIIVQQQRGELITRRVMSTLVRRDTRFHQHGNSTNLLRQQNLTHYVPSNMSQ